MNNSIFDINYTKVNILYDSMKLNDILLDKISYANINKSYTNIMWFLENSIDLLIGYDVFKQNINILSLKEYGNIINSVKQILNKYYNGY